MKKLWSILLIHFVELIFAQLDHVVKFNADNWGANDEVIKIEEYKYNAGNNPKASNIVIYTFQNGKLLTLEDSYNNYKRTEKFEYNAKGNPIKFTVSNSDGIIHNSVFNYDKKGKLIEISPENPKQYWRLKYKYDASGKLATIERYINDVLSDRSVITKYTDESNYDFINEMYSSADGKKINETARKFVNGQEVVDKKYFVYGADENGVTCKIRENNAAFGLKYYYFRKITYKDGSITGSVDYNPYFTEGINAPLSDLSANKFPKAIYKIRMGEDGKFKMAYNDSGLAPDLSKGFISPNKTDFIYFDPNNGEVALAENMKPSAEYVSMKPYNTPSKKYIVINTDYQFIIFENGKQIDSTQMKISQDMNNLVVSENGVPKYFIPNFDKLTFLKYYPLYILVL